jgi:putative DNA primase/helicase
MTSLSEASGSGQSLIREAAQQWLAGGFSVLPIGANKKTILSSWARFQHELPSLAHLDMWFGDAPGVAVVCGRVSGNLEMLELEARATDPDTLVALDQAMDAAGVGDLWYSLGNVGFCEISPSGGMHLMYRIGDNPVPGNSPVARRPSTPQELSEGPGKYKVLAETRGEGGYVVVAPTPGTCHPSGLPWMVVAGKIGQVPTITWDERNAIHAVIHSVLDEMPAAPAYEPKLAPAYNSNELRPGDDFNNRARWDDILEPEGWTRFPRPGSRGETLWTRPGKRTSQGASASTGYANDGDRLYVFSSSTEFETERPYDKFSAYALLNHGGDLAAAASALRKAGFGSPRQPAPVSPAPSTRRDPVPGPMVVDQASAPVPVPVTGPIVLPAPSYSLDVARTIAPNVDSTNGTPHMVKWRDEWYRWNGAHWKKSTEGDVRNWVYSQVGDATYFKGSGERAEEVRWPANPRNAGAVASALGDSVLYRASEVEPELEGIFCANGVLDLETRTLMAPDPARFNLTSVPHDYDPDAKCPRWERFLDDVLPDDKQAQNFLQEWFGYVLSGRTDIQKMASLIGSKRSGKGTIGRVITKLVGQEGVSNPTLDKLGGQFGEQGLIGKSLAVMSDVRWDRNAATEAVPSLLAIIGEDGRSIPRKNLINWDGQLGVRFMAMSNDSPKFSDASGAMASRMIHIRFRVSFLGRENFNLTAELLEELPGIMNWALEGLDRLNAQGRFTEPESGQDIADEVEENSAPIRGFVRDCAELDPEAEVTIDELYRAYDAWYRAEGYDRVPIKAAMSRDLKSAFVEHGIQVVRLRRGSGEGGDNRVRVIRGIRLQEWVKTDPKFNLTWMAGQVQYRY